jgi:hypothetical protein
MLVRTREGEGSLKWGQWWWMGGSHREAVETVALGREPNRRRGLQWRVSTRRTRRVAAGDFSSTSVVRGSEGKKEGPLRAQPCGRGRRRRGGPGCGSWQCRVASNGPWPSGTGGGAIVQQGRAVGPG